MLRSVCLALCMVGCLPGYELREHSDELGAAGASGSAGDGASAGAGAEVATSGAGGRVGVAAGSEAGAGAGGASEAPGAGAGGSAGDAGAAGSSGAGGAPNALGNACNYPNGTALGCDGLSTFGGFCLEGQCTFHCWANVGGVLKVTPEREARCASLGGQCQSAWNYGMVCLSPEHACAMGRCGDSK